VLCSGIVELCVDGVVVEVLHRGHTFGETAIIGNPHSPNLARSAIAAELLWLPVSIVGDLIVEYPDALNPLAADLARRISALHNDLAESRRRASVYGLRHAGAGDALLTR
jgi:CRP-like cAMP-binding protein